LKTKIEAFTILEVTITMLIAGIVISIAYTAYGIISKSFLEFKSKNEDMAMIANIDHLLKRDFDRADMILSGNSGIELRQYGKSVIYYEFANAYIVRKSITTDTFKVVSRDVKMYFEHQAMNSSEDMDTTDAGSNRIDELSFMIDYKDETISCHFYKQYSSVNLMQSNVYALH